MSYKLLSNLGFHKLSKIKMYTIRLYKILTMKINYYASYCHL